ncbi:multicopper oxidase family protein [Aeromicrobium ginsengisoli]|uniref:Multicopper oxidase family protein n=1 Tax=Aeromicrobium ginsengisoli TaxID=363867 RepID=A0A5M4FHH6_9ACTN|nr:multicopper oxidase family protein [Aeromicrobium ginsengisoli]KAA1399636.1 multicopper oxidase family protein [Aeromicrobium ginsengisoli]
MWHASLVPSTYSVMDMGHVDAGGGPKPHGGHHGTHTTSVKDLVEDPQREADVVVELTAQRGRISLSSGRSVDGFTLNGQSPGPAITARVGQLVEVRVTNDNVPDGIALHWHGIDVPNAEDGVAGVTQDAIRPGDEHTYRFVVDRVGSYWYHSHQVSHVQVVRGLFGPLTVLPAAGIEQDRDVAAVAHTYRGIRTLNGAEGNVPVSATDGETVRVRAINTDNGPMQVWCDASYRVVAVDGTEVNQPSPVSGRYVTVTAGGRIDLAVVSPARVHVGGATTLAIGSVAEPQPGTPVPKQPVDLLTYGAPTPTGLDAADPDREFTYSVGRKPGFVDGVPGMWWSINGHLFPDVPMFLVAEGDVVVMHIENHTGDVHPMHLHGHHALVLSRNGEPATGSPWWTDSLNVRSDERFDIAFVADNPGVWMDHCHNLTHAADGLIAHLMYEGVTTPYVVGGDADNSPE